MRLSYKLMLGLSLAGNVVLLVETFRRESDGNQVWGSREMQERLLTLRRERRQEEQRWMNVQRTIQQCQGEQQRLQAELQKKDSRRQAASLNSTPAASSYRQRYQELLAQATQKWRENMEHFLREELQRGPQEVADFFGLKEEFERQSHEYWQLVGEQREESGLIIPTWEENEQYALLEERYQQRLQDLLGPRDFRRFEEFRQRLAGRH